MAAGLEISVNMTRVMIREVILNSIKELHEEQDIEMRDIISELLSIASAAVTKSEFDLNEVTISTFGSDPDECDSEDDEDEEWALEYEQQEQFQNSDVNKQIESLSEESFRLSRLERHMDAVKLDEKILILLPEHAMRWNKTVGNDKYSDYCNIFPAESLMRAYVALLDSDGLERIRSIVLDINKITKFMDQEIFDMDYLRFKNDIGTMKNIYEFIRNNPNFPQKNLFKELSIDGRKAAYMLNWADKLGCIQRIRHKDTWLLSTGNA